MRPEPADPRRRGARQPAGDACSPAREPVVRTPVCLALLTPALTRSRSKMAATTSVEDMNEADFMTLGRWLMTNTKDMEVRISYLCPVSQHARLSGQRRAASSPRVSLASSAADHPDGAARPGVQGHVARVR